jgi:hypothetical protein
VVDVGSGNIEDVDQLDQLVGLKLAVGDQLLDLAPPVLAAS